MDNTSTIDIGSIEEIGTAAEKFISLMGDDRLFCFRGEMGAGKTTFISEVCRRLGVTDPANSPSFSIINEYEGAGGRTIYHFDFYRLEDPSEAEEIGVVDYFYSGNLCLMEWPEMIGGLLPEETVEVAVRVNDDGSRTLVITR